MGFACAHLRSAAGRTVTLDFEGALSSLAAGLPTVGLSRALGIDVMEDRAESLDFLPAFLASSWDRRLGPGWPAWRPSVDHRNIRSLAAAAGFVQRLDELAETGPIAEMIGPLVGAETVHLLERPLYRSGGSDPTAMCIALSVIASAPTTSRNWNAMSRLGVEERPSRLALRQSLEGVLHPPLRGHRRPRRGAVMLVTWRHELPRLLRYATSLETVIDGPFEVVLASPDRNGSVGKARALSARFDLPVISRPARIRRSTKEERQCRAELLAWFNGPMARELAEPLGRVIRHVEDWLLRRWQAQIAEFYHWVSCWRRLRPAAVVVSRGLPEGLLPALAAGQLGIPAFSLPHGMVEYYPPSELSQYGVTSLSIFRSEEATSAAGTTVSAGGLLSFDEYEWSDRIDVGKGGGDRIGILLLSSLMGLYELSVDDIRARLWNQLREVLSRRRMVTLFVKSHPGDREGLRMTCPTDLAGRIEWLPARSDPREAFRASKGIILAGPNGSAALHAVLSELPVARMLADAFVPDDLARPSTNRFLMQLPLLDGSTSILKWLDSLRAETAEVAARHRSAAFRAEVIAPDRPDFAEIIAAAASSSAPIGSKNSPNTAR